MAAAGLQLKDVANQLERHESKLKAKEASLRRKLNEELEQQETVRQRRAFYSSLETSIGPKTIEAQSSLANAKEEFNRYVSVDLEIICVASQRRRPF